MRVRFANAPVGVSKTRTVRAPNGSDPKDERVSIEWNIEMWLPVCVLPLLLLLHAVVVLPPPNLSLPTRRSNPAH